MFNHSIKKFLRQRKYKSKYLGQQYKKESRNTLIIPDYLSMLPVLLGIILVTSEGRMANFIATLSEPTETDTIIVLLCHYNND